ncbi:MAG: 2,3-bisphosphoglycerate-independent phosphoglycerate mutase, partial [Candidatus Omnitrophica bacterium]|nr:2,3-bisphosphoglycerate-independent phosphoglycerate mutase [Candidatus Omnitrophota bacterium]
NSERSLYKNDPYFANTKTIGWVHNNGQDYQFKVGRHQNGVDLLSNLGLPAEDYAWFLDPHRSELMNFMAAFIRHSHFVVSVSPGQMYDYLKSDDKGCGEGLSHIFRKKMAQQRLFALTNGISLAEMQEEWYGRPIFNTTSEEKIKGLLDIADKRRQEAKYTVAQYADFWPETGGKSDYVNEDNFVVVMVSRITSQKGIHFVAPFVRRVIESGKYPDVSFVFGGKGDSALTKELRQLCFDYPGRVGYSNGYLPDPHPLKIYHKTFMAGDLFIALSTWEPGGISPMEALAFGVPCVASDRQGHKSTVKSIYVPEFAGLLGINDDEQGFNGVRVPIDDWSTENTVNNTLIAFDCLYKLWKARNSKWQQMRKNALFSDNSWDKTSRDAETLFKYAIKNEERYYKSLYPSKAKEIGKSSYPASIPTRDEPDSRLGSEEVEIIKRAFGSQKAMVEDWVSERIIMRPSLNVPAEVDSQKRILYVNPGIIRGPPEQLRVIFEGHEFYHIFHPEKSEVEVRNLTIEYLINNKLLRSHIEFLQNNNIELAPEADWLQSLRRAQEPALTWIRQNAPELAGKTIVSLSMEGNMPEFEGYDAQNANLKGGLGIYFGDKLEGLFGIGIKAYGIQPMYSKVLKKGKYIDVDYNELIEKGLIERVYGQDGRPLIIEVYAWDNVDSYNHEKNILYQVEVYKVNRGGTYSFLLESSVFDILYTENRISRFTQEVVFGKAAYQLLKRLNITPDILHLNEAHTVVAAAQIRADESFDKTAIVYTIHTNVPAGLEMFPEGVLRTDVNRMMYQIGISERKHTEYRSKFLRPNGVVDFCYAATHLADVINGVSKEHSLAAERLFKHMYGDFNIQIIGVLNGSGQTWKCDKLRFFEDRGLVPSEDKLWAIHEKAKRTVFREVEERTGIRLDPTKPTAWMVRRIVDYKSQYPMLRFLVHLMCADHNRSFTKDELKNLWFKDTPDLKNDYNKDLVENALNYLFKDKDSIRGLGMQVVVGGPEYEEFWVSEFKKWSNNIPELKGRFVYVPNSDVRLLKMQAIGADICINMPRPLDEACGTSDQRTGLNGGVNIALKGAGPVEWITDYNRETGEGSGFLLDAYTISTPAGAVADTHLFYNKAPADIFNKLEIISSLFYTEKEAWKKLMHNSYLAANSKVTAMAMEQRYALYVYKLALKKREDSIAHKVNPAINSYPLPVPEEARREAEKIFGQDRILTDIEVEGFDLQNPERFRENNYEILKQRLEQLRQLFGRAPPELGNWRLIVTADLAKTQGNVAACDIDSKAVFIHLYFFNISQEDLIKEGLTLEQLQFKILYHELISHIVNHDTDDSFKPAVVSVATEIPEQDREVINNLISGGYLDEAFRKIYPQIKVENTKEIKIEFYADNIVCIYYKVTYVPSGKALLVDIRKHDLAGIEESESRQLQIFDGTWRASENNVILPQRQNSSAQNAVMYQRHYEKALADLEMIFLTVGQQYCAKPGIVTRGYSSFGNVTVQRPVLIIEFLEGQDATKVFKEATLGYRKAGKKARDVIKKAMKPYIILFLLSFIKSGFVTGLVPLDMSDWSVLFTKDGVKIGDNVLGVEECSLDEFIRRLRKFHEVKRAIEPKKAFKLNPWIFKIDIKLILEAIRDVLVNLDAPAKDIEKINEKIKDFTKEEGITVPKNNLVRWNLSFTEVYSIEVMKGLLLYSYHQGGRKKLFSGDAGKLDLWHEIARRFPDCGSPWHNLENASSHYKKHKLQFPLGVNGKELRLEDYVLLCKYIPYSAQIVYGYTSETDNCVYFFCYVESLCGFYVNLFMHLRGQLPLSATSIKIITAYRPNGGLDNILLRLEKVTQYNKDSFALASDDIISGGLPSIMTNTNYVKIGKFKFVFFSFGAPRNNVIILPTPKDGTEARKSMESDFGQIEDERVFVHTTTQGMIEAILYFARTIGFKGLGVLDAGSGRGELSFIVSTLGAEKVYAADINKAMIEFSERVARMNKIENIEFINKDFSDLPDDLPVDVLLVNLPEDNFKEAVTLLSRKYPRLKYIIATGHSVPMKALTRHLSCREELNDFMSGVGEFVGPYPVYIEGYGEGYLVYVIEMNKVVNTAKENSNSESQRGNYPARLFAEIIAPTAWQLENLKLYFGKKEIIFVDNTASGKIADIVTIPGKIAVLEALAAHAPLFDLNNPASQAFQILINDIIRHEQEELKSGFHEKAIDTSCGYFSGHTEELIWLVGAIELFNMILDDDYLESLCNKIANSLRKTSKQPDIEDNVRAEYTTQSQVDVIYPEIFLKRAEKEDALNKNIEGNKAYPTLADVFIALGELPEEERTREILKSKYPTLYRSIVRAKKQGLPIELPERVKRIYPVSYPTKEEAEKELKRRQKKGNLVDKTLRSALVKFGLPIPKIRVIKRTKYHNVFDILRALAERLAQSKKANPVEDVYWNNINKTDPALMHAIRRARKEGVNIQLPKGRAGRKFRYTTQEAVIGVIEKLHRENRRPTQALRVAIKRFKNQLPAETMSLLNTKPEKINPAVRMSRKKDLQSNKKSKRKGGRRGLVTQRKIVRVNGVSEEELFKATRQAQILTAVVEQITAKNKEEAIKQLKEVSKQAQSLASAIEHNEKMRIRKTKDVYSQAEAAFEKENYLLAISLFKAAIDLEKNPPHLFTQDAEKYIIMARQKLKVDFLKIWNEDPVFKLLEPRDKILLVAVVRNLKCSFKFSQARNINYEISQILEKAPHLFGFLSTHLFYKGTPLLKRINSSGVYEWNEEFWIFLREEIKDIILTNAISGKLQLLDKLNEAINKLKNAKPGVIEAVFPEIYAGYKHYWKKEEGFNNWTDFVLQAKEKARQNNRLMNDGGTADLKPGVETIVKKARPTVLIVDDSQEFQNRLKERLLKEGYNVLQAFYPHEAKEIVNNLKQHIDMVIHDVEFVSADIIRPVTADGIGSYTQNVVIKFVNAIRQLQDVSYKYRGKRLPLIVVSGDISIVDERARRLLEHDVNYYISKDSLEDLLLLIKSLFLFASTESTSVANRKTNNDPARTDRPLTVKELDKIKSILYECTKEISLWREEESNKKMRLNLALRLQEKGYPQIQKALESAMVVRAPPKSNLANAIKAFEEKCLKEGHPLNTSCLNIKIFAQDYIIILPEENPEEKSLIHEATAIMLRSSGLTYEQIHNSALIAERLIEDKLIEGEKEKLKRALDFGIVSRILEFFAEKENLKLKGTLAIYLPDWKSPAEVSIELVELRYSLLRKSYLAISTEDGQKYRYPVRFRQSRGVIQSLTEDIFVAVPKEGRPKSEREIEEDFNSYLDSLSEQERIKRNRLNIGAFRKSYETSLRWEEKTLPEFLKCLIRPDNKQIMQELLDTLEKIKERFMRKLTCKLSHLEIMDPSLYKSCVLFGIDPEVEILLRGWGSLKEIAKRSYPDPSFSLSNKFLEFYMVTVAINSPLLRNKGEKEVVEFLGKHGIGKKIAERAIRDQKERIKELGKGKQPRRLMFDGGTLIEKDENKFGKRPSNAKVAQVDFDVLVKLIELGKSTAVRVRNVLGLTEKQAYRSLKRLNKKGLLVKKRDGRYPTYSVPSDVRDKISTPGGREELLVVLGAASKKVEFPPEKVKEILGLNDVKGGWNNKKIAVLYVLCQGEGSPMKISSLTGISHGMVERIIYEFSREGIIGQREKTEPYVLAPLIKGLISQLFSAKITPQDFLEKLSDPSLRVAPIVRFAPPQEYQKIFQNLLEKKEKYKLEWSETQIKVLAGIASGMKKKDIYKCLGITYWRQEWIIPRLKLARLVEGENPDFRLTETAVAFVTGKKRPYFTYLKMSRKLPREPRKDKGAKRERGLNPRAGRTVKKESIFNLAKATLGGKRDRVKEYKPNLLPEQKLMQNACIKAEGSYAKVRRSIEMGGIEETMPLVIPAFIEAISSFIEVMKLAEHYNNKDYSQKVQGRLREILEIVFEESERLFKTEIVENIEHSIPLYKEAIRIAVQLGWGYKDYIQKAQVRLESIEKIIRDLFNEVERQNMAHGIDCLRDKIIQWKNISRLARASGLKEFVRMAEEGIKEAQGNIDTIEKQRSANQQNGLKEPGIISANSAPEPSEPKQPVQQKTPFTKDERKAIRQACIGMQNAFEKKRWLIVINFANSLIRECSRILEERILTEEEAKEINSIIKSAEENLGLADRESSEPARTKDERLITDGGEHTEEVVNNIKPIEASLKKPLALIILDGFGVRKENQDNAIALASKPTCDRLVKEHPFTLLKASGLSVGLPDAEMGNSEVGHLNIGSGRVVKQDVVRINESIEDNTFFSNPALKEAVNYLRNNPKSNLHIMGLISNAVVHSALGHLSALLRFAKQEGLTSVYIHAITDGRDSPPQSGREWIRSLLVQMEKLGIGKIATVMGRYYAMDRDKRWDRVKLAYDLYTQAKGKKAKDVIGALEESYKDDARGDEFIKPVTIVDEENKPLTTIKDGDVVIFFNFRADRAREMTRAFMEKGFKEFECRVHPEAKWVCMTEYDEQFYSFNNLSVMFPPKEINHSLAEVLSQEGLIQLHIAETEKYAHVTFFFNGRKEKPFENEERIIVPSTKEVPTYDLKPEMSAYEVTENLIGAIKEGKYDFIVVNFANPDMVGHTGRLGATIEAVETVDACLGKLLAEINRQRGIALVIADHGNAEEMAGEHQTSHTTNPVPCILVDSTNKLGQVKLREGGALCDVAPTLLDILGIEKPKEMTGESLIIRFPNLPLDKTTSKTPRSDSKGTELKQAKYSMILTHAGKLDKLDGPAKLETERIQNDGGEAIDFSKVLHDYLVDLPGKYRSRLDVQADKGMFVANVPHEHALEQIIIELVSNALAEQKDGLIEVGLRRKGEDKIAFSVKNRGPIAWGILREKAQDAARRQVLYRFFNDICILRENEPGPRKIMSPISEEAVKRFSKRELLFVHGLSRGKEDSELGGVGVGLFEAHKIVEYLGGSINFNTDNTYTKFIVILPAFKKYSNKTQSVTEMLDGGQIFNFAEIIDDYLLTLSPRYRDRIDVKAEKNIFVETDNKNLLWVIIAELIKNAIDEQKEGLIKVRLTQKESNRAIFTVENRGAINWNLLLEKTKEAYRSNRLYHWGDSLVILEENETVLPGYVMLTSEQELQQIREEELPFILGLTTKEKRDGFGGKGCGLCYVCLSVKKLGGSINFNTDNTYTKFIVILPAFKKYSNKTQSVTEMLDGGNNSIKDSEAIWSNSTALKARQVSLNKKDFATYFFRDYRKQLIYFEDLLLRMLKEKLQTGDRSLRIWSAGSYRGCEAYTIAIILQRMFEENKQLGCLDDWDIKIVVTDAFIESLEYFEQGKYTSEEVVHIYEERTMSDRGLILNLNIEDYFEIKQEEYLIKESLRSLVDIKKLNLLNKSQIKEMKDFDIVFCKNVYRHIYPWDFDVFDTIIADLTP